MYTRCTTCRTVFHITVAELRAADGRVVCGQCEEEFDALENLSDTLPPPEQPGPAEQPEKQAPRSDSARDEDDFLREVESLIDDETDPEFPNPDDVFSVGDADDGTLEPIVIADSGNEAGDATNATAEPADQTEPLPLPTEVPARARWPRIAVLLVVALTVAGAWVHSVRGSLLRHPAGQALLAPVYSLIGMEVSPDWSPAQLKVLRSATVADPDQQGSLRVNTEFRNAASFDQPYPVLRVTLEDRWGGKVDSRDFTPSEYLETHVAGRLMRPGERVRATVSMADPGARADGFRVDLCLEGAGRRLDCSAETSP